MSALVGLPRVSDARLPAVYERAKLQLAECARVDKCKDWSDKAAALASYAKQSEDHTLEKFAMLIRARAVKRCGQLLKEIERPDQGGRPKKNGVGARPVSRVQATDAAGISEHQRKTALRVASIPDGEFETLLDSDTVPTITSLAKKGTKTQAKPLVDLKGRAPAEFQMATHAQGRVRDLAEAAKEMDQDAIVRGLFERERPKLLNHARDLRRWLDHLINALETI